MSQTSPPPTAPPPPPPAPPRRLVRRTDDRVIGGVASGLADYLNLDPVLVRVAFVVLAFAGGAGILAYLALWLLTPEGEGQDPFVTVQTERGIVFWVAIGLLVLGGAALVGAVLPASGALVWPLLLIGAGVALWRSDQVRLAGPPRTPRPPAGTPGPTGPVTPTPSVPLASEGRISQDEPTEEIRDEAPPSAPPPTDGIPPTDEVPPTDPPPGWPAASSPGGAWRWKEPRRRSRLGRITAALALLTAGVLALLTQTGVIAMATSHIIAWTLVVVSVGLLVSTFVGRGRGLIALGALVLVPALVVATLAETAGIDPQAGIGERRVVPASVAELAPNHEYGVGSFTLDLRDLDFAGERVRTAVHLGVGELRIHVPPGVRVELDYEVAIGQVTVDWRTEGRGRRVEGQVIVDGEPGGGVLLLDASVGIGQLDLRVPTREEDE